MNRSVWKLLFIGMSLTPAIAFAQSKKTECEASNARISRVDATQAVRIASGETSIEAVSLCKQNVSPACGVAVDPYHPEFDLYTNKVVLLRIPRSHTWQDDKSQQGLAVIASAEPCAVIVIADEAAAVKDLPAFSFPVVSVAAKDSSFVIQAAARRQRVSILFR